MNTNKNSIMWSDTPLKNKPTHIGWSKDAIIRVYSNDGKQTDSSNNKYDDFIAYNLYYDNKDNRVYLKDIRNDVLYDIPTGSMAKGYTLAFKLNLAYNEAI